MSVRAPTNLKNADQYSVTISNFWQEMLLSNCHFYHTAFESINGSMTIALIAQDPQKFTWATCKIQLVVSVENRQKILFNYKL